MLTVAVICDSESQEVHVGLDSGIRCKALSVIHCVRTSVACLVLLIAAVGDISVC